MIGADGKGTPVQGALVEVYRTDIKSKFPSDTTDKKGNFNFAGLPLGAVFILSISGPSISPEIYPNVKAGDLEIVIKVRAGDGRKYTEDEVRKGMASAAATQQTGELTAEQKAEKEKYDKEVARVTAQNEKAKKSNEVVNAAVKEGGEAFKAKNYDLAIAKFEEGYQIDPDFAGTAPAMLNNKAMVLLNRATDSYNSSTTADAAKKSTLRESAKNDLMEVIKASERSVEILKGATAPTDPNAQKNYEINRLTALEQRKKAYRLLAQTSLEMTKGPEALAAFQEYMAVETDAAKKSKAQVELAQTMLDSQQYDTAVTEFKKVLETDPNNVDALAGLGLSLVTVGYVTMQGDPEKNVPADEAKGKQQLQEAATYLQKFVDTAPPDHKLVASVKESMADLKNLNIAPQKGGGKTTPAKKKN